MGVRAGDSWWAAVSGVALEPRKPTGFRVTADANRRFRLRASVDNGGSAITLWQYRIATSSGGLASAIWRSIRSNLPDALDFTLGTVFGGGLTRYFQVRAVNSIGNGVASDADSATTADVITTDTDTIYNRAASEPTQPTGGTNSETHLPTGWGRTELSATALLNVYRSQRTRTYTNGSFTRATAWGAVVLHASATGDEPGKPTGYSVTATAARGFRLRASADNGGVAISKWQRRGATTQAGIASAGWTDIPSSAGDTLDWTTDPYSGGTTRFFQVRAVNSVGNGEASDIMSARVADVVTTDMQTVYTRAASEPGAPGGGTNTENHVPTGWQTVEPGATALLNVYSASRTRTFINGAFSSATAWADVTLEASATGSEPAKPTGFTVATVTDQRKFRLRASVDNGGSAITLWQYRIATSSGGLASASWTDIGSSASDALDFTLGTVFGFSVTRYFQVRAVNDIGNGQVSDGANATTRARRAPGAVRNLIATASPALTLVPSFDAPNSGDPVERYEYRQQRISRLWDSGFAIPAVVSHPTGLAVASNGNILVVGSGSTRSGWVYRYNGTSWDGGLSLPSGVGHTQGVAVAPNGDILIVNSTGDAADSRVYRHNGTSWDGGLVPQSRRDSTSEVARFVEGLAVASNGDILIVDRGSDEIYRYNGTSWDSGLALPSAATQPRGLAVASNGDILLLDGGSDKIYRYNGTSWDSGIAVPSAATQPEGVAIAPNGDTLIVDVTTDRVYRYAQGAQSAWQSIGTNRSVTLFPLIGGAKYKIDARPWNPAGYGPEQSVEQTVLAA